MLAFTTLMLNRNTYEDEATWALAAVDAIARALGDALGRRGRASLALAGGTTPVPIYHVLSEREDLPWQSVQVTLTDERWVPVSSSDSNEKLVRDHFLAHAAAQALFVPLKNDAPSAPAGLERSMSALRELLPLDVAVLGMGEDGHVASLFPGQQWDCGGAACVEGLAPNAPTERISLSLETLSLAGTVLLCIGGEQKRALLDRMGTLPDLPISRLAYRREIHVYEY